MFFQSAPGTILGYLGEEITMVGSPSSLATVYKSAKPFPHLIFHNLFPAKRLDSLVSEIGSIGENGWVIHDEEHISKANLRSAADLKEDR